MARHDTSEEAGAIDADHDERVRFAPGSTAFEGDHVALVSAWRDVLAVIGRHAAGPRVAVTDRPYLPGVVTRRSSREVRR